MKLTNTLRTIAFSGLGLLAGASTLTIPAQDAHAMSSTTQLGSSKVSRTSLIKLGATPTKTGTSSITGDCGQAWMQNNYLTGEPEQSLIYACPGEVIVSVTKASTQERVMERTVALSGQRFITPFTATEAGEYLLEVRYEGSTEVRDGKTYEWSPYYLSQSFELSCAGSGSDLSRDGVDQNCDGVDGIKSTIELSSTGDYGASVGDQMTVNLQLSPNPGVRAGTLEIVDADGSTLRQEDFATDSSGNYQATFRTENDGVVKVRAAWDGDEEHAAAESNLEIVVNTPAGVGIVVIAADPSDVNYSEIESLADQAFDMMLTNGIASANLRYLHSDYGVTSNWRATHDATAANLSASIDTWAVSQINTSSTALAEQSPLYVFIIGGGDTDYVWIDSSTFSASTLDQDLDDFSTSVNSELVSGGASASSALPIYVVLDSDKSGSFADDLGIVDGRVILSSTGDTALNGDNPRTGSLYNSYSYLLYSQLNTGASLGDAHDFAESSILLGSSLQIPFIDADGDGVVREASDYAYASNAYVGHRSAGQYCPVVSMAKADTSHTLGAGNVVLWTSGYDFEDFANLGAYAQILPPAGSGLAPEVVALSYSRENSRFEAETAYFTVPGSYSVTYYLVDSNGAVSFPKTSSVEVSN